MGTHTMKPISRVRLADEVQSQIRQAIVSREIEFGAPLSEPKLADRFGVSRAPVREALIALEREGLVEFVGGGRTRVITIGVEDFAEICTLRSTYERLAGQLVAKRWGSTLAATLEDNLARQRRSTTWAELSALDMAFHEAIVAGSGNARLLAAWRVLRPQCEACLVHFFGLEKELGHEPRKVTVAAHEKVIAALSGGDPDAAGDAMAEHAESWMSWLEHNG
ncbi:MAG: FCD domain-containing protein [Phycisphaera sp.]|nr:FCD domain-containing protein [Phycisphaera sp.]